MFALNKDIMIDIYARLKNIPNWTFCPDFRGFWCCIEASFKIQNQKSRKSVQKVQILCSTKCHMIKVVI